MMMKRILITTFFVVVMATPLAAQPITAADPATMASAMEAPRAPAAMRRVVVAATMRRAVSAPSTTMTAAPVAPPTVVMGASAAPVMAPDGHVMSAAAVPTKTVPATTTEKKDSKGSVVGGWVLQLLLGILGIALPIILTPLVFWILKKMKVEDVKVKMLVDEMVDKAIGVGIHYAEEHAHKLKDNPIDGAKKLDIAGKKAQAYLKDSGVVDKGSNYIKDLIEAKLGEGRSNGVMAFEELKPEAGKVVVKKQPVEEEKSDDK